MLEAKATQFSLDDAGHILYQHLHGNPLPGEAVAVLRKGAGVLSPDMELIEGRYTTDIDRDKALEHLRDWLKSHTAKVLEPLLALILDPPAPVEAPKAEGSENAVETAEAAPPAAPAEEPEVVRQIAAKVFSGLGIIPREDIESEIKQLDPSTRRMLRARKVRLGPVLAFVPELNKPAAVRLRAVLWSLHNGRALPAPVPRDGSVSVTVDPQTADRDFYRAIGYPVYGDRAIRIDMLDRVISAVYDGSSNGKFKASHAMAEWLGCSIPVLYGVLEAMGHRKVYDPAEEAARIAAQAEAEVSAPVPAPVSEEIPKEEETAPAPAVNAETQTEAPKQPQAKPELATFALKRSGAPRQDRPERENASRRNFTKPDQASFKDRKPAHDKESREKKFGGDRKPKDRDGKDGRRDKPRSFRDDKPPERPVRVLQSGPAAKPEDSPFAILGQLKVKSDAG